MVDKNIGNTGGLGGVFGIFYALGYGLPFPEAGRRTSFSYSSNGSWHRLAAVVCPINC